MTAKLAAMEPVKYLTEQRASYLREVAHLEAQAKGVESKLVKMRAKVEAITEAIDGIPIADVVSSERTGRP